MKTFKQTITKEFKLFTLEELKADHKEVYENILNEEREDYQEMISDFYYDEFVESIKAITENFDVELSNWSFGVYNYNNYMELDFENYFSLENHYRNEHVKELNNLIKQGKNLDCEFTGVYTDNYFFDYFEDKNIKEVTYNDFHKHFENAIDYALYKYINDLENEIENDELIIENLIGRNDYIMFDLDGNGYTDDEIKTMYQVA